MAANPRIVANDITVVWDGVSTFVPRGTIVDIPAGSAQEAAYGLGNLVSMSGTVATADAEGDVPAEDTLDAGGGTT